MPKSKVTDLITDQEMAFALLVLSGTMTDRQAAEAVGLNPDTAAYTKSKPRVRAFMLEHRARMQQQIVEQEAEGVRRQNQRREQVLERLWEIAGMSSEMTRGSITGQVKALSMIVAIEGLIPDRRAGSAEKKPASSPTNAYIDPAAWRAAQQAETTGLQTIPAQEEDGPGIPEAEPAPGSAAGAPLHPSPLLDPGASALSNGDNPTETQAPPYAALLRTPGPLLHQKEPLFQAPLTF
jgi:hypothetical protein